MVMAQTRRKTDWFCLACKRVLRNGTGISGRKDTITPVFKKDKVIGYRHDQCGGGVDA